MTLPSRQFLEWFCAALAVLALAVPARAAEPTREQLDFFEKKIRPVLVKHCYECHSPEAEKVKGKLLLDTRDGIRKGGVRGPAVVPGNADESLVLSALRYDALKMPPAGKLPDSVAADFETWIKNGAVDPREGKPLTASRKIDIEAGKKFWAFQPPRAHRSPAVRNADWPKQKIDRFILAELEKANLTPSAPADRRTWIRRVTFDLTGLPPTPADVDAFVNDQSADAEAKVVERLLASPQYGERWARLWLDVARFAEDQAHIVGKDQSLFYPNAWLYRDWVIKAFNNDMPYDRFVKLQLAADLLEPDDPANHAALGLLGLGPKYYSRKSLAVMSDEWEDRVDVATRGLMGLTVACARCHDHKFDPITTEDYYALAGVFASTSMFNRPLDAKGDLKSMTETKQPAEAMHMVREGNATDLTVFIRGDVNNKGPVVPRRFLRVLSNGDPKPFGTGSGRQDLADAIASRDNPLTARVLVNRVWAAHFGRPLVGTASNFGNLGDRPTHPELLDDLALRFIDNGWSLKWLHREIVLSATYRQSSEADASRLKADPENRLLGRMNQRRLSVEAWRDSLLAATGRLDLTVGGKSIDPMDPNQRRRTVYSSVSRLELNRMLAMFDYPDPNIHADRRVETTTPLQKLFVLNSPFMVKQATAFADRLFADVPNGDGADAKRIERAYTLLYSRPPSDAEKQLGLAFLKGGDSKARWQQYAHVLLAANEMMYID